MDLETLRTFLRVAELRSFTAAGDEALLARGVVSRRIAQLEADIGQALFTRSTRRVDLTPAGELLVESLQRALHEIELGLESVRALRTAPGGLLRVTAPVSWGQRVLARRLPEFLAQFPHIEVEMMLDDTVADLAADRFDLGFRMSAVLGGDLVAIPIEPMRRRLYASADYAARNGMPLDPADLARHEVTLYWRASMPNPLRIDKYGRSHVIAKRYRYRANSPEAVLAAVLEGLCIGVLPDYMGDALADRRLRPVLADWTLKSHLGDHVHAVGLRDRMQLARVHVLLDFLRRSAASADGPG